MILFWISIPDLHYIHRGHPPNFVWIRVWIRSFGTPSKIIVSTAKVHVQTDRQKFFCLFCVLRHTKHEHSSKGENFFSTHAITILSLFTYSVCDEKVKIENPKLLP